MEYLVFSVIVLNYAIKLVAAFLPDKPEPRATPRGPFRRPRRSAEAYSYLGGLRGREELQRQLEAIRQAKMKIAKKDKVDWAKEGF